MERQPEDIPYARQAFSGNAAAVSAPADEKFSQSTPTNRRFSKVKIPTENNNNRDKTAKLTQAMTSSPKDLPSIDTLIEVPFHDIDPMNIVWHGRYVKYLEVARCNLLESFDYNYGQMRSSGYAWPVVDMRIKYVKPLRFEQKVRIHAQLEEWEYRLKIRYTLYDANSNEKLTKAYTIQVAVDVETEEMCYESPAVLKQKLGL